MSTDIGDGRAGMGDEQRLSFGAWAQDYDRYRPGYPAQLGSVLLGEPGHPAPRVLDIGAGTGQLARMLLAQGYDAVAVEPDDRMREVLAERVGPDRALSGSAEALPAGDGEFDAVLGGQMWHWVDPAKAVPEIARVLRPGGLLGALWILRDDRVPWVAELRERVTLPDSYTAFTDSLVPRFGPPFGPTALTEIAFDQVMDAEALLGQLGTLSVVARSDNAREQLAAASDLVRTHPALAGESEFSMPFICKAFTARLANQSG